MSDPSQTSRPQSQTRSQSQSRPQSQIQPQSQPQPQSHHAPSPSTSTSTPTHTKRDSLAPHKNPSINIHPTALIDPKAVLSALPQGPFKINIGPHAIVSPFATIKAAYGDVTIGERTVVWERVTIGLRPDDWSFNSDQRSSKSRGVDGSDEDDAYAQHVSIGERAVISSGSTIHAGAVIGENSVLEPGVEIGVKASVGNWCKITANCNLADGESVGDFVVVFDAGGKRRRRVNGTARGDEGFRSKRTAGHDGALDGLVRMKRSER